MKRSIQQLEETLRVAHGQRPLPKMDEDWHRRVMQEIHRQSIKSVDPL